MIKLMIKTGLLMAVFICLVSCLLTHQDIEDLEEENKGNTPPLSQDLQTVSSAKALAPKPVPAKSQAGPPAKVAEKEALASMRLSQMASVLRGLRGQIDVLTRRQADHEFRIQKLNSQFAYLENRKNFVSSGAAKKTAPPPPDNFQKAADFFKKNQWKQAIVHYEQYRTKNKTGKKYKKATLQIAYCFQNLKMKKEAQVFFKEVIQRFPKSKEAKKARESMK